MPDLDEQIRELVTAVEPVTADEVLRSHRVAGRASGTAQAMHRRRMRSYVIGAVSMAMAIAVLVVVLVVGVLPSSKPTVVSPARPSGVPSSWQKVTFGGLTLYAPSNWPVHSETVWDTCDLGSFSPSGVTLDTGAKLAPPIACPPNIPLNVSGLLIDPGPNGPLGAGLYGRCQHSNGLDVCPVIGGEQGSAVETLAVYVSGRSQPVAVEIGLAGNGQTARTILDSMRSSGSTAGVNAHNTKYPAAWSSTLVVKTNPEYIQQVVQGPDSVYATYADSGNAFAVLGYNAVSRQTTHGPSVTGLQGGIAVVRGWVWLAAGQGKDIALYQLDPSTLSIHAKFSLVVKDNLKSFGDTVNPVLVSTANGPLWVDGGEDLWGINPSSGAVETELNTRNMISSMSTNPDGGYLYGGGETARGEGIVVAYDAETGAQVDEATVPDATEGVAVSGTAGGVWITFRTGNAGNAVELSQSDLRTVASPTPAKGTDPFGFRRYGPVGGLGASVVGGVLWLSSQYGFACADPRTGEVRAYEHELHVGPGSSFVLYQGRNEGLVALTPPKACFG